jgi:hypothetical protein
MGRWSINRNTMSPIRQNTGVPIMGKVITKKAAALLEEATEMFNETGCVPGIDGEEVPAERMVPDAKEYMSETIDDPEVIYDPKIWDTPGFTLVLSWLAQKWLRRCSKLVSRSSKNPEQYLTKEQQKACLDSAAAELIREITQRPPLH